MKELQQRPTQAQHPVRYYIVKTEHDDRAVVRSVPVARAPAPPAPSKEAPAASPAESERAPDRRRDPRGVGRLMRAAASIRRHPSGQ